MKIRSEGRVAGVSARVAAAMVFSAVAIFSLPTDLLAASPKSEWAKSLRNRTAVLKQDLPTLVPQQAGLLVVTPDRGTLFHIYDLRVPASRLNQRKGMFDRSPEQLLLKVKAHQQSDANVAGVLFGVPTSSESQLVFLKTGATITIADVDVARDVILVSLWDEFDAPRHTRQETTSFSIFWPTEFSKDFRERAEVEVLIDQVLQFRQP